MPCLLTNYLLPPSPLNKCLSNPYYLILPIILPSFLSVALELDKDTSPPIFLSYRKIIGNVQCPVLCPVHDTVVPRSGNPKTTECFPVSLAFPSRKEQEEH